MRRIINMLTISLLAVGLVAGTAVAATNNTETKKFEADKRPEKNENEVIGKITSIDANNITVTLAEMKKPEGKTNFPPQANNNANNNDQNKERPEFNIDDMFTLTGTTKTYTITNAKLIKNKRPEFNKDDNANKSANKDETKKKTREELEAENKATYTDFAVGDYVIIELESNTSTTAKTVRSFDRMGGRGFGFSRDFDKDFNKNDNRKNGQK